ncbi:MAG: hypothetical protein WCO77_05145 [bacterium]
MDTKIYFTLMKVLIAITALTLVSCQKKREGFIPSVAVPIVKSVVCQDYWLPRICLSIDMTGNLLLSGKELISPGKFDGIVAAQLSGSKSCNFLLEVDTNAPLTKVWSTLDTWRKHGGYKVSFVVTDGEGGFGAINCLLPVKEGGASTNGPLVMKHDAQPAFTIRVENDCLLLNDEVVTPDMLSARLKKLRQETSKEDKIILVISSQGATITNFVKVLVLFWETGRPGLLCAMEES